MQPEFKRKQDYILIGNETDFKVVNKKTREALYNKGFHLATGNKSCKSVCTQNWSILQSQGGDRLQNDKEI